MNEKDFKQNPIHVTVCTDPSFCGAATKKLGHALKEETIFRAIKDKRNGLGLKGKVLVQKTSCQGWCDYAPVCTVWPQGKVYHRLKPQEAEDFLKEAVLEDRGTFDKRRIWEFDKSVEENHDRRKRNGVKNPSQTEG